ncbi:hypothetical protein Ahy_B06g082161 [Arachis hypogaea]|uniref:Uncharacterized protein n=1 Tax=Arachis hypogaea TaxID=3818 RepID=A0A444YN01_ARAHY|nr:hypothetical protein Ahy_B06g082161 [Arachis hypogaea]
MAYTSHILDQVKTLGFRQATVTSIFLGVDDLLTIPSKGWLVQDAEQQSFILEKHHHYGNVHAVEKLRQSIEIWYATSEYLRQEMSPNFRMTDPLNPVHIMSFSGARGNVSQVHQLVADNSGARQLMCIRIIGAGNRRYASIGDIVVAVIKKAVPNMSLERSEVIRAVIVRTCKELKRSNGMIIQYDDNAAVVIDQE